MPFRVLVLLAILVNVSMLGAFDPLDPESASNNALNISEYVFLAVFAFECVVTIVARGAVLHRGAYFRDGWNWLDFIIVLLAIVSVIPAADVNLTAIRALRVLRALRLLKALKPLRIQMETLLRVVPHMVNASLFLGLMLLMWTVIGLQVFSGKLRNHCVNPVSGVFDPDVTCALNYTGQGALCMAGMQCTETTLNPAFGRINFDNFAASFLQVFQVVTQEGWSSIAVLCMDATSTAAVIFFVVEILFGTLILVNLFVAIVHGVWEEAALEAKNDDAPPWAIATWWKAQVKRLKKAEAGRDARVQLWALLHRIVDSVPFAVAVYSLITINLIVLSLAHFPMSDTWNYALDTTNLVLNALFTVEIIVKLAGLGLYLWASDGLNLFDAVVVAGSWIEIGLNSVAVVRQLRALRMLRIFALWPSFARILRTIVIAVHGSLYFMIIFFLFMYIFAVAGMQTFGGQFFFATGYVRWNFDTLWNAMISVFVVIAGDNWPDVMGSGMQAIGWSGTIYFIALVSLGSWVVLKLYLAILLGAFDEEHEEEEQEEEEEEQKQDADAEAARQATGAATRSAPADDGNDDDDKNTKAVTPNEDVIFKASSGARLQRRVLKAMGVEQEMGVKVATAEDLEEMEQLLRTALEHERDEMRAKGGVHIATKHAMPEEPSLWLFDKDNAMRRALFDLVSVPAFEVFMLCVILASCVFVGLDNWYWAANPTWDVVSGSAEMLFMVVFGFEMVFKIVSYGLVLHKGAYLRNAWNVLDFGIVVASLLSIVLGFFLSANIAFLRAFRAFRAFRLLGRFQTTRTTVRTMLRSVPAVLNVILFSVFIWYLGALIAVQLLQGQTALCTDTTVLSRSECTGTFLDPATKVVQAREWVNRVWGSFDNVGIAFYSLFPVIGVSGWVDILYDSMDKVGPNMQPQLNASPGMAVFFLVYVIICSWFCTNLFIGAIADTFMQMSRDAKRSGMMMTEAQMNWVNMQRQIMRSEPKTTYKIPQTIFREYCYRFVINKYFTYFMATVIGCNVVVLSMTYYGMSAQYKLGLDFANAVFMGVFVVEMVLKMVALGLRGYFSDGWLILDFVIVLASVADVLLAFLLPVASSFSLSIVRVLRIVALLKLVRSSKKLRMMMRTLAISIPPIFNVLMLWSIITFVYAVVGVAVFGSAQQGEALQGHATFATVGSACFILFRIVTGESWEIFVYELSNEPNNIKGASAYFYTYLVVCGFLMVEVVVGIVLDLFTEHYFCSDDDVSADAVDSFTSAWAKRDRRGTNFVPVHDLPGILRDTDKPLGPGPLEREHMLRYMMSLPLPVRKDANGEDAVYYADVLRALLKMSSPRDMVWNNPKALVDLERRWMNRFPHLKPLPDRINYSLAQYVATVKLQRAYRRWRVGARDEWLSVASREARAYQEIFSAKGLEHEMRASAKRMEAAPAVASSRRGSLRMSLRRDSVAPPVNAAHLSQVDRLGKEKEEAGKGN